MPRDSTSSSASCVVQDGQAFSVTPDACIVQATLDMSSVTR